MNNSLILRSLCCGLWDSYGHNVPASRRVLAVGFRTIIHCLCTFYAYCHFDI